MKRGIAAVFRKPQLTTEKRRAKFFQNSTALTRFQEAKDNYRKSPYIWQNLAQKSKLAPNDAGDANIIQKKINEKDKALAHSNNAKFKIVP